MASRGEKNNDFYAVLGLKKECTASELRNAYKRLILRWHPDRCSSSGNSKFVEEAKKKFQDIQEAYSVLSDANKRFLYDVGVYDSDDDENSGQPPSGTSIFWAAPELASSFDLNPLLCTLFVLDSFYDFEGLSEGMGDFLNEMAVMMSQTKSNENGEESFEELQQLFEEMFERDGDGFNSAPHHHPMNSFPSSASASSYCESSNASNKRNSAELSSGMRMTAGESSAFEAHFQNFCFGTAGRGNSRRGKGARGGMPGGAKGRRQSRSRTAKISSGRVVSMANKGESAGRITWKPIQPAVGILAAANRKICRGLLFWIHQLPELCSFARLWCQFPSWKL